MCLLILSANKGQREAFYVILLSENVLKGISVSLHTVGEKHCVR